MSRTIETPTRRSRRLLKNGYYYYSDMDSSFDEEATKEPAGGSLELPFEPERKITYKNSHSPDSRRKRSKKTTASRSRHASSEVSERLPNRQYYHRVTKEVTRTLTQTRTNQQVNSRHEASSTLTRTSAQPNLHGNHLPTEAGDGKGLEVHHMYGLEEETDDDHLVTRIHAGGGGESSRIRRRAPLQPAARVSALNSTPNLQTSPLVTITTPVVAAASPPNTRTTVDRRSTVYSDNEDVELTSAEQKTSSKRRSSSTSTSKTLFDTKKKGKKQSLLLITLLRSVFNFLPFLVAGLLRRGKLLYQTVARMLLLDTWFLTAASSVPLTTEPSPIEEEISIFSKILHTIGKVVRVVLTSTLFVATIVSVLICVSTYTPQWLEVAEPSSSKPEVVVVESTVFGDSISKYFPQMKSLFSGDETQKEWKTQPSFQETNEYKALIQTVRNLESSLRTLELNVADRESKMKEVARNVENNNVEAVQLIHQVKGQVEEEIRTTDSKSKQELESRFTAAVDLLNTKIIKLQDSLNVMEMDSSSNLEASHQKIDAKNLALKKELMETKESVRSSQKQLSDIILRLEIVDQRSKLPKKEPFNYAHVESLVEKRFIELFILLLRTESIQKAVQDENLETYKQLRSILAEWLDSKEYLTKEEFEHYASENLTADIRNEVAVRVQQLASIQSQRPAPPPPTTFSIENLYSKLLASGSVTEGDVKSWITDALETYNADRLGLADFALESSGGYVVGTRCTEHYNRNRPLVKVFGIPVVYHTNTPRTVLQPNVMPGECWAFKGHVGYIVIGLSYPIYPSSVTLEHIPRALALSNITSAPRDFEVYGLDSQSDIEGVQLGQFRYEETGRALQNFNIENPVGKRRLFKYVEIRVTSNWGNPDFTCIYRIRVHGTKED